MIINKLNTLRKSLFAVSHHLRSLLSIIIREVATNNLPKLLVLFRSLCVAKMVIYPDKLTFSRLD